MAVIIILLLLLSKPAMADVDVNEWQNERIRQIELRLDFLEDYLRIPAGNKCNRLESGCLSKWNDSMNQAENQGRFDILADKLGYSWRVWKSDDWPNWWEHNK